MHRLGFRSVSKANYLRPDAALLQSLIRHQSKMDVWEVRPLERNNKIVNVNISKKIIYREN